MKIALAQMKMDTDIEKNFQKSLQLICETAEKKADLICFPEIQLSPFFPQFPDCDVSEYDRHEDNRKWFALIATISRDKLGIDSTDEVDVLNVKIDDLMLRDILLQHPGFILDIT